MRVFFCFSLFSFYFSFISLLFLCFFLNFPLLFLCFSFIIFFFSCFSLFFFRFFSVSVLFFLGCSKSDFVEASISIRFLTTFCLFFLVFPCFPLFPGDTPETPWRGESEQIECESERVEGEGEFKGRVGSRREGLKVWNEPSSPHETPRGLGGRWGSNKNSPNILCLSLLSKQNTQPPWCTFTHNTYWHRGEHI